MTSTVSNQSDSEPRLHRVLYFLFFLRAMLLHLFFLLITIGVYLLTGWKGAYSAGAGIIDVYGSAAAGIEHHDGSIYRTFGVGRVALIHCGILALHLWMYFSISRVWRTSLQLLSALLVASSLIFAVAVWQALDLSVKSFSPVVTFLLLVFFILTYWYSYDIIFALGVVEKAEETSGFDAVLDRRLSRGVWNYVNRILDLPRTPLTNRKVAAAYILNVVGALVFLNCLGYVLSVGWVLHKSTVQTTNLEPEELYAASGEWGREIILYWILSIFGLKLASIMRAYSKRVGGLSVTQVLHDPRQEFILYLRSFASDKVVLPYPKLPLLGRLTSFQRFPARVEEQLFDVADGYLPLIAVADPGESSLQQGGLAYREHIEGDQWKEYVLNRVREAKYIVVVIQDTSGIRWELERILLENAAEKTFFLFDPTAKDPQVWQRLSDQTLSHFRKYRVVDNDFRFQTQALGFRLRGESIVEICNDNWSSTSYRTAFSYFLATSADSK